jgi:PAS domain S-box-containing protein
MMNALTEQIIDRLGTIVIVLNENGLAEYVSPSSYPLLGFHPEELLGDGWLMRTRFDENERTDVVRHLTRIQNGTTPPLSYERLLRTAYGGQKWILWNTSPAGEGKLIGIGYDITERKRKEELLLQRTNDLDERNKEMESSLRYAQRIQAAIMPDVNELRRSFSDAFVFYKPKDIVSGDFWWYHETSENVFVAALDCTGHGVPGALMSVLAHSILREVFFNRGLNDPAEILREIDEELFIALNRESSHRPYTDGMDIALCCFEKKQKHLHFSGAYRPLLLARKGELIEYPASRYPIGFYSDVEKHFSTCTIELEEGDTVFLFSDGFADQFGGEKEKKLNKKRFRELLSSINGMKSDEQESFLEYALVNWKQEFPQTDDILVMGLKI